MYIKYIETELKIYNLIWFNDIQNGIGLEQKKQILHLISFSH